MKFEYPLKIGDTQQKKPWVKYPTNRKLGRAVCDMGCLEGAGWDEKLNNYLAWPY